MPVRWEFRPQLLVVVSSGVYPNEAIEKAVDEAVDDARFEPGMSVLFDGRNSQAALASTDIAWRIRLLASLPARGFAPRAAFLVRDGYLTGLTAGQEIAVDAGNESVRVRMYSDEDDAVAWLRQA